MKRTLRSISLLALLGCIGAAGTAYAIDPPHNAADQTQQVGCLSCHLNSTATDSMCLSCHNPTNMSGKYGVVQTHEGVGFTISCLTCHNPHYQDQIRTYPDQGYTLTGTTSSIGTNTLTDTTSPFGAVDQYKDYTLVPNLSYPKIMYRISGNTAGTLTVEGTIRGLPYAGQGKIYAIVYGKMVRGVIATPNSGSKQVKFFTSAENVLNNFADGLPFDSGTGKDTVVEGVCQVCHTTVTSFKNDGTLLGANHPEGQVGKNCSECHSHQENFKASCSSCHGYPPVDATLGGPSGLAKYTDGSGTGAPLNPGKHQKHATSTTGNLGYVCNTCHTSYVMPEDTTKTIDIGFNISGAGGGTYDAIDPTPPPSTTPPNYRGNNGTVITYNGSRSCSNIYCHSDATKFSPPYNPPATTAAWDVNAAALTCSGCHTGPPTGPAYDNGNPKANSHNTHVVVKNYLCVACHSSTVDASNAIIDVEKHVNKAYDVTGADIGSYTYNAAGGTCSTYCHSTGQSTTDENSATPTYATPTWGDANSGACGTCHKVQEADGLTSGSHAQHLGTVGVSGCSACHTGAADGGTEYNSANHINKLIDVSNSYTAGGAPGNGYGNCTTMCHNNGLNNNPGTTPTWGATVAACSACHPATPTSGSHATHLSTTTYAKAACGDCHDAAVAGTTAPTTHLDGDIDVFDVTNSTPNTDLGYPANKGKGTTYSSCTTAYCHSTGQSTTDKNSATPTYATVTWGDTAPCGSCHKVTEGTGLISGSHAQHLGAVGVSGCGDCHTGATSDAYDSSSHVNRSIDVSNSYTAGGTPGNGYGNCTTMCHNNGLNNNPGTSPEWGSTVAACAACHPAAPTSGSHTTHLSSGAGCGDCHDAAVAGTTAPTTHLDGDIDVFDVTNSTPNTDLGYPANKGKGTPYSSCTTAYCHSNGLGTYKSATWGGTSTGCTFCHAALPTSGSHADHVKTAATSEADYGKTSVSTTGGVYDFGCGNCHPVSTTAHRNGTLDITLNKNHGGTLKSRNNVTNDTSGYTVTAGPPRSVTCSASYCHSKGDGTFTVTSPDWYGTFTGDTCGHCHGNQPDTNAHGAHAVAIHYTDIYSNGTGKIAESGAVDSGAAHGDPNTSTTINCNMCHYDTVTSSANDKNNACVTCHTGANLKGNAAIAAASTKHLDGSPTVAFNAVNVKSKAQIRNDITTVKELNDSWTRTNNYKSAANSYDAAKNALNTGTMWTSGTKTCSNISCHNSYSVTWTSTTTSCSACHTTLP